MLAVALGKVKGDVTLRYIASDAESLGLAVQISKAFEAANQIAGEKIWTVHPDPHTYVNQLVLSIRIPDRNNATSRAIQSAFSAAQIAFELVDVVEPGGVAVMMAGVTIGPTAVRTEALIIIGSKRPPF